MKNKMKIATLVLGIMFAALTTSCKKEKKEVEPIEEPKIEADLDYKYSTHTAAEMYTAVKNLWPHLAAPKYDNTIDLPTGNVVFNYTYSDGEFSETFIPDTLVFFEPTPPNTIGYYRIVDSIHVRRNNASVIYIRGNHSIQ